MINFLNSIAENMENCTFLENTSATTLCRAFVCVTAQYSLVLVSECFFFLMPR